MYASLFITQEYVIIFGHQYTMTTYINLQQLSDEACRLIGMAMAVVFLYTALIHDN